MVHRGTGKNIKRVIGLSKWKYKTVTTFHHSSHHTNVVWKKVQDFSQIFQSIFFHFFLSLNVEVRLCFRTAVCQFVCWLVCQWDFHETWMDRTDPINFCLECRERDGSLSFQILCFMHGANDWGCPNPPVPAPPHDFCIWFDFYKGMHSSGAFFSTLRLKYY